MTNLKKRSRNKKKLKVAILGPFGKTETYSGGQVVKCRNLYQELKNNTDWQIQIIDTDNKNKNTLRLCLQLLKHLLTNKHMIVLLAKNGRRILFPMLYLFARIFKTNIYHDVIGGNLAVDVKNNTKMKRYLNSFRVNWVETELLKQELEEQEIRNVQILPNFRCIDPLAPNELNVKFEEPLQLCYFAKVSKEKGVEDAISAVINVNKFAEKKVCELMIYGAVEESYSTHFMELIKEAGTAVKYKGSVPTEKAQSVLKEYYATVFPTHWIGESNAGTVTESFFAGVPVIATDWRCNGEMITSGWNGLLYPSTQASTLEEAIIWMIRHRDEILTIKKNCLISAERYTSKSCIKQVIKCLEQENE